MNVHSLIKSFQSATECGRTKLSDSTQYSWCAAADRPQQAQRHPKEARGSSRMPHLSRYRACYRTTSALALSSKQILAAQIASAGLPSLFCSGSSDLACPMVTMREATRHDPRGSCGESQGGSIRV